MILLFYDFIVTTSLPSGLWIFKTFPLTITEETKICILILNSPLLSSSSKFSILAKIEIKINSLSFELQWWKLDCLVTVIMLHFNSRLRMFWNIFAFRMSWKVCECGCESLCELNFNFKTKKFTVYFCKEFPLLIL